MPAFTNASSLILKCVVLAGWITKLRQSPTLAKWLKSFSASMNERPCSRVPLISKLNTEPAPRGPKRNSFCANAWLEWLSIKGWPTRLTNGWLAKNSTTFSVFDIWRSIRKGKVSMPCKISQALCGLMQAPKSRRPSRRARNRNAPTVLSSVNTML